MPPKGATGSKSKMPPHIKEHVNKVFDKYKSKGNDHVDLDGFGHLCKAAGYMYTKPELKRNFDEVDTNKDGKISRQELFKFMEDWYDPDQVFTKREKVIYVFRAMDKDKNSYISKKEFSDALVECGEKLSPSALDRIFDKFDTNGDGHISVKEFL